MFHIDVSTNVQHTMRSFWKVEGMVTVDRDCVSTSVSVKQDIWTLTLTLTKTGILNQKLYFFSTPNQVTFVPTPNQMVSTASSQDRITN